MAFGSQSPDELQRWRNIFKKQNGQTRWGDETVEKIGEKCREKFKQADLCGLVNVACPSVANDV